MDQVHSTTNEHKKGSHLTYDERMIIQIRLKDGMNPNQIAKEIRCAPNTVRNEISRGTVLLYHGKVPRYKASVGQETYKLNRQNCCRHYDLLEKADFFSYVVDHFKNYGRSLDACAGRALLDGFSRNQIVCTKTLYNYIDLGLLEIMNLDLPEKLKRKTKNRHNRENKRIFGRSIEERPIEVESREEFGHWESDLVIGSKSGNDKVLLTLLERKSLEYWMIPIQDKSPQSVMKAIMAIKEYYREHFSAVFKTITTDNGTEFSSLSDIETSSNTLVFFAHPYSSFEKGTIERHNGLIRRFIPKGKRIDSFSVEQISQIELWCNSLPRKKLGYLSPDEIFEEELDKIYTLAA